MFCVVFCGSVSGGNKSKTARSGKAFLAAVETQCGRTFKRRCTMNTVKSVTLSVALLGMTAMSQAAVFSNFEPSTYTAGATVDGQDGWTVYTGTVHRSRVTPSTDYDTSGSITLALDGTQSLHQYFSGSKRLWNGLYTAGYIADGLEISWLQQKDDFGRSALAISPDVAGDGTPVEMQFDAAGNIKLLAPNSGLVDSGIDYLLDKTYRFTMKLDFALNTMTGTAENLTDSGPVVGLGSVSYDNAFETALIAAGEANGGLVTREQDGARVFLDTILVNNASVPEPGATALIALAGIALRRRRS